jgi:3-isopropylmalate/(R)-2-methylmalate dehydratase small subunit
MTLISGTGIVLSGPDVDTDRIMPARFLKVITFAGLEAHVFEDDRRESATRGLLHPFDDPARAGAAILIVGTNFGCGSSREHAPQGLHRRGIRAIVGASFAEIFAANAQAIGLPCVTAAPADLERITALAMSSPQQTFSVDLERLQVIAAGQFSLPIQMPDSAREAFLSGTWDATAMLLAGGDDIARVEASLSY